MKPVMAATLAIIALLAASSSTWAEPALDTAEMTRFQQASFKGDCTGYAAVAETLLGQAEKDRTSSTPYVLASASLCAAKAGQWSLSESLALRMFPKTIDERDWLLSVPLERLVVELADMPGGASIALRIIERNDQVVGQYPGDLQRRQQALKVARAASLYTLGRANEAAGFVDPKLLDLQVDRRFEATWMPPAQIAADNVAGYEEILSDPALAANPGVRFEAAMALNRVPLAVAAARELMAAADGGSFGLTGDWDAVNARTALILALMRTGRVDAALEAYEEGAPPENGRDITFYRRRSDGLTAVMLIKADRIAEARALLAKLKPVEIAEDLGAAKVLEACASKLAGGAGLADGQAVWIGTVWNLEALLCAASEDQVAAQVIKALDQPRTRLGSMAALQTYLDPPPLGKTEADMRAMRAKFLNRPDIKAAIGRRGRILETETYRQE